MSRVTVLIERALMFQGQRVESGTTLDVESLHAAHLLDSGRARLLYESDRSAVAAARKADNDAIMRSVGRPPPGTQPGSPWVPR